MHSSAVFATFLLHAALITTFLHSAVAAPGSGIQSAVRTEPSPVPLLSCPDKCKDEPWAVKDCMMAVVPCEVVKCPDTKVGRKPRAKCAPKPSASPSPTPSASPMPVLTECPDVCKDAPWAMKDCMNTTAKCQIIPCPYKPGQKPRARCAPIEPTPTPAVYYR